MKYIYLLTIASTILLMGCDKNELESLPKYNANAIEVTLNAAYGKTATKTSINGNTVSWKLGDQLGLYTKGTGGNNNVPFDLNPLDDGKTSGSFFGALTAFTGSIFSYYPYKANSGVDATQVPVEIPVDGTQTYNGDYNSLGDFDAFNSYSYMVSTPVENQKLLNNAPVAIAPILNYEHVTTVLNFKLTSNAAKSLTINHIKLSCPENSVFIKSGTLNLTEMNIEKRLQVNHPVKVDRIQVTLPQDDTKKLVIGPKATKIVRMVLFPAKLSGLTITFTINATIEGVVTPVDLIVTKAGMDLLRGMSYDVPVTIDVVDTPQAAQGALSNGAETVVVTQPITGNQQLIIPKATDSSKPNNISISAPITGTVTIQQETGVNSNISLVNTSSTSGSALGSAIVDCPTGTVNITGGFNEITATTAENTLIVEAGTTINKLTVHRGNVQIYGTVTQIVKGTGYNGTITTYVKDSADLIRKIEESNNAGTPTTIALLGGKEFIIAENIRISAPLTILSDNRGNPATLKLENTHTITCTGTSSNIITFKNLEIIGATNAGTGVINATGNVNLTIDGCKIIQNTEGSGDGVATMAIGIHLTNSNNNLTVNHSAIYLKKNYQIGICAYANGGIGSVTFNNSQITTDNAGIPKTYSRGINIGDMRFGTQQQALLMDNSIIEGVYYAVNVTNTAAPFEKAIIEITNSKLDGRCGFNVWKGDVLFKIENTTMIGRNYYGGPTESFGDVVLNASATNTTLNFTNCIFKTERNPSTANNLQFILDIRSTNNTINFSGSNRIIDNGTMNYFIDCGSSDKVTGINTITIESNRPGVSVLLKKNIWDGKMVSPVAYNNNYTIYTAAELAWIADQVTYQKNTFAGKTITLCNDLDLNQLPWTPIGCAGKHS
ncbi:MAG: fimbrillin family protein, partial [Bacteroidales bacterium]